MEIKKEQEKIKDKWIENCDTCNKEFSRREEYFCITYNKEKMEGLGIDVIYSEEINCYCSEECFKQRKHEGEWNLK